MIKVSNGRCIRNISKKSMRASRTRNLIAILAIALTTLLFTSLFTIALSVNESFQEANFHQVGGYVHGSFKGVTREQLEELKEDPLIKEYGTRLVVGVPKKAPFQKTSVEISYGDANWAKTSYIEPEQGELPKEGTMEAATDTRVLSLLGVEPGLGEPFSLTFDVDGTETTQEFTLSGWWEYDPSLPVSNVVLPRSRAESIFEELGTTGKDGITSLWSLEVMFDSSMHIEEDMQTVLSNHGFQSEEAAKDNYIDIGVNWGYSSAQMAQNIDVGTIAAIVAILVLILFTGYLIIYNVFQISVVGDIRFYGMLKTIGTTPRQLRRILRNQAFTLSLAGIPIGLFLGWFVGAKLTPVILSQLNGVVMDTLSVNPLIFVLSAVFSLVTVLLSCLRPGRMAGKVSPVEAVRYTEGNTKHKKKRSSGKVSLVSMAKANLGRSKGKTIVTILSLALAVVLLNLTITFTNGFDMDKYLRDKVSDFIVANAAYFKSDYNAENILSEDVIEQVEAQEGIEAGTSVYATTWNTNVEEFVTEDYIRKKYSAYSDEEEAINARLGWMEQNEQGLYAEGIELYGMEDYGLDKVNVIEGDIDSLKDPEMKNIAAVYQTGDYGEVYPDSHWAKLGDIVTLRYVESYEYYNPESGEVYGEDEDLQNVPFKVRAIGYRDVEYKVTVLVTVPKVLGYRYYGRDRFLMNDQTFIQDTGTKDIMLYAFDMKDQESTAHMEQFLEHYTNGTDSMLDYESKSSYEKEFNGFRNMFLMLGSALSFIVGLVGILNFFNAILTGILTRKREFAMLQSIGMTGKQLKTMLVWEGLYYVFGAIGLSLILAIIMGPVLAHALESMFWFFTYHFSVLSILILTPIFVLLGCGIPLAVYRTMAKDTIVERLREIE